MRLSNVDELDDAIRLLVALRREVADARDIRTLPGVQTARRAVHTAGEHADTWLVNYQREVDRLRGQ